MYSKRTKFQNISEMFFIICTMTFFLLIMYNYQSILRILITSTGLFLIISYFITLFVMKRGLITEIIFTLFQLLLALLVTIETWGEGLLLTVIFMIVIIILSIAQISNIRRVMLTKSKIED